MQRRDFLAGATTAALAVGSPSLSNAEEPMANSSEPLTTTDLALLERDIAKSLEPKPIGELVFVRYLYVGDAEGDAILVVLAHMAHAVREWMGVDVAKLFASGSLATGQVNVSLHFTNGSSALVSFAKGEAAGDGAHLHLLGNRGALTYGPDTGPQWSATSTYPERRASAQFQATMKKSLESGRSAKLQSDEQP